MRKQETDMWPDDYYREMDGKNRKKLLDEALGSGSEETADEDRPEERRIRKPARSIIS